MQITTEQLMQATGAELVTSGSRVVTSGICTDTRHITPDCVFFALSGENFDANCFAAEASQSAAAVIVSRIEGTYHPACTVLRVTAPLLALQKLAQWWRGELADLRVVGVTGSSGKTSTKDMVRSILEQHFEEVTATCGNLNNHIGVPLSILSTEKTCDAAVWEMGMNHAGELAPLCALTQPQVGIITHIGSAHIGLLGSRDAIAQEKCTLARALPTDGCMIFPSSDDYSNYISSQTKAYALPVGGKSCAVRAEDVRCNPEGCDYKLIIADLGEIPVHLPVPGEHMVNNSLLAAAAGWKLGCALAEIATGLGKIALTKGRLSCRSVQGILIVDDTYNANPESMTAALHTVASMPIKGKHYAVLGKMGELGDTGIAAHAEIGKCAANAGYAGIVMCGESCAELSALASAAQSRGMRYVKRTDTSQQAAEVLHAIVQEGDAILFKGSRSTGIERVINDFLKQD